MGNFFIYLGMVVSPILAVMFFFWIKDGHLGFEGDELYGTIGAFVSIYGCMVGCYTYWWKNIRNRKNK